VCRLKDNSQVFITVPGTTYILRFKFLNIHRSPTRAKIAGESLSHSQHGDMGLWVSPCFPPWLSLPTTISFSRKQHMATKMGSMCCEARLLQAGKQEENREKGDLLLQTF
jgi:hypothetical protein